MRTRMNIEANFMMKNEISYSTINLSKGGWRS